MIPLWLVIKIDARPGRRVRLWVPLLLVWLVLLPFAIVLVPVVALLCLMRDINPIAMFCAAPGVLAAVSGTHVEIQHPHASVLIRIV